MAAFALVLVITPECVAMEQCNGSNYYFGVIAGADIWGMDDTRLDSYLDLLQEKDLSVGWVSVDCDGRENHIANADVDRIVKKLCSRGYRVRLILLDDRENLPRLADMVSKKFNDEEVHGYLIGYDLTRDDISAAEFSPIAERCARKIKTNNPRAQVYVGISGEDAESYIQEMFSRSNMIHVDGITVVLGAGETAKLADCRVIMDKNRRADMELSADFWVSSSPENGMSEEMQAAAWEKGISDYEALSGNKGAFFVPLSGDNYAFGPFTADWQCRQSCEVLGKACDNTACN